MLAAQVIQVQDSTSAWEVVTAVGTFLGGVAAAVAAISARRTSREALEALAVGIEPQVSFFIVQREREPATIRPLVLRAEVANSGKWRAHDLELIVEGVEPNAIVERREQLDGLIDAGGVLPVASHWDVELREITPEWPIADRSIVVTGTLRYWDERGIGRYEQRTQALSGATTVNGLRQWEFKNSPPRRIREHLELSRPRRWARGLPGTRRPSARRSA